MRLQKNMGSIAYNILYNEQDSEECVNDTYLNAWDNIPPHNPDKLSAYLGKITRNLALNKWDYYNASKREKGQLLLVLEEIQECISSADTTEKIVDELHFTNTLNSFLASLPKQKRIIFFVPYLTEWEGQVFGIGCKIFTIAGPVILYGIFASWVLGLGYWVLKMFKMA